MAWPSTSTFTSPGLHFNTNDNQATYTKNVSLTAGRLYIHAVAVDNNSTTDGDEGAVTSVTDTLGNTWVKAIEFTNGQGAAQAGVTCSVWYCQVTTGGSAVLTTSYSNSTSRDASNSLTVVYNGTDLSVVSVEGTNTLAEDASSGIGSLDATTANANFLRVRFVASETNNGNDTTATSGWSRFDTDIPADNGSINNSVKIWGEYRIVSGTGSASDPTPNDGSPDRASVYIVFTNTVAPEIGGASNMFFMF